VKKKAKKKTKKKLEQNHEPNTGTKEARPDEIRASRSEASIDGGPHSKEKNTEKLSSLQTEKHSAFDFCASVHPNEVFQIRVSFCSVLDKCDLSRYIFFFFFVFCF
jgi:hypothetical protein